MIVMCVLLWLHKDRQLVVCYRCSVVWLSMRGVFLLISYSNDTDETLSACTTDALSQGCQSVMHECMRGGLSCRGAWSGV